MGFAEPDSDTFAEFPNWAKDFYETLSNTLDPGNHLKANFDIVKRHLFNTVYSYIEEGMYLNVIRYKRLYEEDRIYSFKEWCDRHYPKSYQHALMIIRGAQIGWELLCAGFQEIPTNISQCLALEKTFKKDDCGQPDIFSSWEWVVQYAKSAGKKVTVGLINFLVNPNEKEEKVKIPLSKKKWQQFDSWAKSQGLNPQEIIETFMSSCTGGEQPEKTSPDMEPEIREELEETIQAVDETSTQDWLDDVQLLMTEHLLETSDDDHNTT